MDTVHASLLSTVCTLLLTEARRIGSKGKRKGICRKDLIDEATDHRVLRGTDEVEVLALDLIHHGIHLCEGHNTIYNLGTNHIWRNHIGKTTVDHEIARIAEHRRVQSRDVADQVVEAVTCDTSGCIEIDTAEGLHDICMIRYLKCRNDRLTEALILDVVRIIRTDRNGCIDHVRDDHHALRHLRLKLRLLLLELLETCGKCADLGLDLFGLRLLPLRHQRTDLLRNRILLRTKLIGLLLALSRLEIILDDLID